MSVRTKRWVLGSICTLVAVLVLLFLFFPWNWLKMPIEARLERATGKKVTIVGDLHGEWAWAPRISFDNVLIQDPEWKGDQGQVGTIERAEVVVRIPPLLIGRLVMPEVRLIKPNLHLARKADGSANWTIEGADLPDENGGGPEIGSLIIEDGKLALQDALKQMGLDATIETVQAKDGDPDKSRIKLQGKGKFRDANFTLHFEGGSVLNLQDSKEPYQVQIDASVGRTKATARGTVTDPLHLAGMKLKTTLEGANAADLFPIAGIAAPDTPPYKLAGTLTRSGKVFSYENFSGTVGDSDLAGNLKFDTGKKRLLITGDLVSDRLALKDLGLVVGAPAGTQSKQGVNEEQKIVAANYRRSERVLPDAPLDFARVRSVDSDVRLKAKSIDNPGLPLENLDVRIKLDDSILQLKPLRVGVAGGTAEGGVVIDAQSDLVKTDYDLRLRKFKLEEILRRAGYPDRGAGLIDGKIQLKSTGNSIRRSLGNADGRVTAVMDSGTLSSLATEVIGLDVAEALGFLFEGDKKFGLRCAVTDFDVKSGRMEPRALVIDTTDTVIVGQGDINLRNERLDLRIEAGPKDKSPLSLRTPILVRGTFKNPSIGVEPGPLLMKGGVAVALGALLGPLGAVLGFLELGPGEDSNCAQLIGQSKQP